MRTFNQLLPQRITPRVFKLLKGGLFKFPPSRDKALLLTTEMPLLEDTFSALMNSFSYFTAAIYIFMTSSKTLLKEWRMPFE